MGSFHVNVIDVPKATAAKSSGGLPIARKETTEVSYENLYSPHKVCNMYKHLVQV